MREDKSDSRPETPKKTNNTPNGGGKSAGGGITSSLQNAAATAQGRQLKGKLDVAERRRMPKPNTTQPPKFMEHVKSEAIDPEAQHVDPFPFGRN